MRDRPVEFAPLMIAVEGIRFVRTPQRTTRMLSQGNDVGRTDIVSIRMSLMYAKRIIDLNR